MNKLSREEQLLLLRAKVADNRAKCRPGISCCSRLSARTFNSLYWCSSVRWWCSAVSVKVLVL